jgi:hypothetical protein
MFLPISPMFSVFSLAPFRHTSRAAPATPASNKASFLGLAFSKRDKARVAQKGETYSSLRRPIAVMPTRMPNWETKKTETYVLFFFLPKKKKHINKTSTCCRKWRMGSYQKARGVHFEIGPNQIST